MNSLSKKQQRSSQKLMHYTIMAFCQNERSKMPSSQPQYTTHQMTKVIVKMLKIIRCKSIILWACLIYGSDVSRLRIENSAVVTSTELVTPYSSQKVSIQIIGRQKSQLQGMVTKMIKVTSQSMRTRLFFIFWVCHSTPYHNIDLVSIAPTKN